MDVKLGRAVILWHIWHICNDRMRNTSGQRMFVRVCLCMCERMLCAVCVCVCDFQKYLDSATFEMFCLITLDVKRPYDFEGTVQNGQF